jgi:hypothetical protein
VPWKLPDDDAGLLALAKSYPYDAPGGSYLFADGVACALTGIGYGDRVPVIAHGSNRAPEQLRRKFGAAAWIPVTIGWLADYDVVYSAHITQYGAVASTLQHAPGARVRLSITWLNESQLARMHETEGPTNYTFGRLNDIELRLEAGPGGRCGEAFVYLGRNGCLDLDGGPIGLAATQADGRPNHARHQQEALEMVRDRHRRDMALDAMILEAVREPEWRRALVTEMKARAVAAEAPHFEALDMSPR